MLHTRYLLTCALVGPMLARCSDTGAPDIHDHQITFARNSVLHAMRLSETTPSRLAPNDLSSADPTWSPDGRYAAYTRYTQVPPPIDWDLQIVVLDTRYGTETLLTAGPRNNFSAAWSPEGQRIAYLSRSKDSAGGFTLNVVDRDGIWHRQLGTRRYFSADWSPDGRYIVAATEATQLLVLDANTGDSIRTLTTSSSSSAAWSPDGNTIAIGTDSGTIYLIDADGGNLRLISDSSDYSPAWSPDGRFLAVESYRAFPGQIVVMKPDGTEQVRLTGSAVDADRQPAWRPQP